MVYFQKKLFHQFELFKKKNRNEIFSCNNTTQNKFSMIFSFGFFLSLEGMIQEQSKRRTIREGKKVTRGKETKLKRRRN
jgi:hypothetical protein